MTRHEKKNTVQRPDADILCVTTHNVNGFLSYYGQGNIKKFASSDSDAQQALLQNILGALNKYEEGENAGYANRDILERSVINYNIFIIFMHRSLIIFASLKQKQNFIFI